LADKFNAAFLQDKQFDGIWAADFPLLHHVDVERLCDTLAGTVM